MNMGHIQLHSSTGQSSYLLYPTGVIAWNLSPPSPVITNPWQKTTQLYDLAAPEILPYEIGNALSAMVKRQQITKKEALAAQKVTNNITVRLIAIEIRRKDVSVSSLRSKIKETKSPFDVPGIKSKATTKNIIDIWKICAIGIGIIDSLFDRLSPNFHSRTSRKNSPWRGIYRSTASLYHVFHIERFWLPPETLLNHEPH